MSDDRNSVAPHEPFIYGIMGTNLWFMPFRLALEWALLWAFQEFATNWGDLLSRLPRDEGRRMLENWQNKNNGKPNPPEDARLTERERESIIGDPEWYWALPMMVHWFPEEALEDFSVENITDDERAAELAARGSNVVSREQWLAANDQKVGWIEDVDCLILPAEREDAIVAHFSKFGIKCVRNDTLIQWAHGEGLDAKEQASLEHLRQEDDDEQGDEEKG